MPDPKYRVIADDLRRMIESGELAGGEQLPTEIELMEQYEASRNTIRDAIKLLSSRREVEARPGQGTFVVERINPIVTTLTEHGIVVAPVRSTPEVAKDPHLWEREMLVKMDDPVAGEMYLPGLTIKFSKTPGKLGPVPTPGQHTDEILGGLLGYDESRIAELRAAKVI